MHLRKYLAVEQTQPSPNQRPIAEDDIAHLDNRFGEQKEQFYREVTHMLGASEVLQNQLSKESIYRNALSESLAKEAEMVRIQFGHLIEKVKQNSYEIDNRIDRVLTTQITDTQTLIVSESESYRESLLSYGTFLKRDFPKIQDGVAEEATKRDEMDRELASSLLRKLQRVSALVDDERLTRDRREEEIIAKIEATYNLIKGQLDAERKERERSYDALLRLMQQACYKLNKSVEI